MPRKLGIGSDGGNIPDGAEGVDMGVLSRDAGFNVLTGAAGIGSNSLRLHFLKHRNK